MEYVGKEIRLQFLVSLTDKLSEVNYLSSLINLVKIIWALVSFFFCLICLR